jgi:MFS superfamily sulfate permease-like transporter
MGVERKPRTKRVLEKTSVAVLGALVYFMDILTAGGLLFPSPAKFGGMDLKEFSAVLFVLSCAVSQGVFYVFSSFGCALVTTPITDSYFNMRQLAMSFAEGGLGGKALLSTTLCTYSLTAMLTGCVFMGLRLAKAEKIFNLVPRIVSTSVFFVVALFCIRFANENIRAMEKSPYYMNVVIFNLVSLSSFLLIKAVSLKWESMYVFMVLIVTALLCGGFYLGALVFMNLSMEDIVASGWIRPGSEGWSFPAMSLWAVDWRALCKSLPQVLVLIVLNIMHYPINLPSISEATGRPYDNKKELLACSISNFATSLLGNPSYLVASSTAMITNAGAKSPKDGALIVMVLLPIFALGRSYFRKIPFMVFDILLWIVGMEMVVDSIRSLWKAGHWATVFGALVGLVSMATNKIHVGLVFAIGLYLSKRGMEFLVKHTKKGREERSAPHNMLLA